MKTKTKLIIASSLALLGLGMSGTGIYMELSKEPTYIVNIIKKFKEPAKQELKITLKEVRLPINSSLSMDIQSYIEETIETNILKSLNLDTSKVDTSKVGEYPYTVTYQKQVFEGKIIVEEKVEEQLAANTNIKLTTKNVSIKLGDSIPQDINFYIQEQITDEIKQQAKLDITNVIINKPGSYQYTISYNNTIYTGTIKIEEDQKIETSKPHEDEKKEENTTPENTNPTTEQNTN